MIDTSSEEEAEPFPLIAGESTGVTATTDAASRSWEAGFGVKRDHLGTASARSGPGYSDASDSKEPTNVLEIQCI